MQLFKFVFNKLIVLHKNLKNKDKEGEKGIKQMDPPEHQEIEAWADKELKKAYDTTGEKKAA